MPVCSELLFLGCYTALCRLLLHETIRGIVGVGDDAIEDCIFDNLLDFAYDARWRQVLYLHNHVAGDGRLEVTNAVSLLQVAHLAAYQLEITQI